MYLWTVSEISHNMEQIDASATHPMWNKQFRNDVYPILYGDLRTRDRVAIK